MNFTTRVFQSGNSKAIRIPKEFGLVQNELVKISDRGYELVIERIDKMNWIDRFFDEQIDDFAPEKSRTKNRVINL